jgi:hypothetical protein
VSLGDPRSPAGVIAIALVVVVLLVIAAIAISQGWVK